MLEVVLTCAGPEGTQEFAIESEKTSFGRGSEVDHYFADNGLSRHHATVYCEGERVWIVDENSTNGTFVNGIKVDPGGTPLQNGDTIKIGNSTTLSVRIGPAPEAAKAASADSGRATASVSSVSTAGDATNYLIPIAVIAAAVMIIGISGVFIGISVFGNNRSKIEPTTIKNKRTVDSDRQKSPDKENQSENTSGNDGGKNVSTDINGPTGTPDGDRRDVTNLPQGKAYLEMSDSEKMQYVEVKAMKVAQMIGNRSAEAIPAEAANVIKKDVDQYVRRRNGKKFDGACRMGGDLEQTYERASRNAPFVIRSFYGQGLDPQIGLYLAMIESEHCTCLQSPTGPLGMFQFARAAARENGLNVKDNASPSNPDERCEPEPASRAAAKYMKTLAGRFGTGPLSIPLAIASYNSGQGALSNNLEKALDAGGNQQRSFWTLVSKAESLSKQFKDENIRYVPKFFAAAIIGENPQDFGMKLQPLSTYTK